MSPRRILFPRAILCVARGLSCLPALSGLVPCLFLGLACTNVQAQAVYKSTGPGGKIIYTDKPVRQPDGQLTPVDATEYANSGARFDSTTRWSDPSFRARRTGDPVADAALETSRRAASIAAEDAAKAAAQSYQMRVEASKNKAGSAPAAVAPATTPHGPATTLVLAPVVPAAAVAAGKADSVTPASGSAATTRPASDTKLEKAVLEVIATQHLVEQAIQVCVANQPADAQRLNAMLAKWHEKNNALLVKNRKLLQRSFTIQQIRDMDETATISNRPKLERANAVVAEVRIKWCEQMISDIGKGVLNLTSNPEIVAALSSVR